MKPWSAPKEVRGALLPLRHNVLHYRGINILLLWGDAMEKGFSRNVWMTFKQAEERGAHVRKGEHGSLVVYADRATKTETNDNGEELEQSFGFMKADTVFNVEQIERLGAEFTAAPALDGDG